MTGPDALYGFCGLAGMNEMMCLTSLTALAGFYCMDLISLSELNV